MEKPAPSFQSFVRAAAPPPSAVQNKPLPPVPSRPRRPSSVYSANPTETNNMLEARPRLPSTEFFLQPIAFSYSNPDLNEIVEDEIPVLLPKTYVPPFENSPESQSARGEENPPMLLEPKVYSPATPSRSKVLVQQHEAPASALQDLRKEVSRAALESNMASSPAHENDVYFLPELESLEIPVFHKIARIPASAERIPSRKKAEAALGLDQDTLNEDSRRQRQRHLLIKRQYKPREALRHRHSAEVIVAHQYSSQSPRNGGDEKEEGEEEGKPESQLYLEDYHAALGEQYRSAAARPTQGNYDESVSKQMRLVPAPLNWKRHGQNSGVDRSITNQKERNSTSKERHPRAWASQSTNEKSSSHKVRLSRLLHGEKQFQRSQNDASPNSRLGARLFIKEEPSSTSSSPIRPAPVWKETATSPSQKQNRHPLHSQSSSPELETAKFFFPFARSRPKRSPGSVSTPSQPPLAIPRPRNPDHINKLALALEKAKAEMADGFEEAKELLASLSLRGADEDDSLTSTSPPLSPSRYGARAAGPSPTSSRSSPLYVHARSPRLATAEKRREELKARIRIVGQVDPPSVDYAPCRRI